MACDRLKHLEARPNRLEEQPKLSERSSAIFILSGVCHEVSVASERIQALGSGNALSFWKRFSACWKRAYDGTTGSTGQLNQRVTRQSVIVLKSAHNVCSPTAQNQYTESKISGITPLQFRRLFDSQVNIAIYIYPSWRQNSATLERLKHWSPAWHFLDRGILNSRLRLLEARMGSSTPTIVNTSLHCKEHKLLVCAGLKIGNSNSMSWHYESPSDRNRPHTHQDLRTCIHHSNLTISLMVHISGVSA